MVEYALMAPLFVTMALWAIYLMEVGDAKIKQQEVTRYVAWEFTARQLSDFDRGQHAARFDDAKADILAEAFDRYRDLQGENRGVDAQMGVISRSYLGLSSGGGGGDGNRTSTPTEGAIRISPARLDVSGSPRDGAGGLAGAVMELLQALGDALDTVLKEAFGFNTDFAAVTAEVTVRIDNRLMPRTFLDRGWFESPMFPAGLNPLVLAPEPMTLQVDSWYMHDGRDVMLPGGDGGRGYLYWKQVQRMHLLNHVLRDRIAGRLGGVMDWIEQYFPIRLPTEAQLVSQNYRTAGDVSGMRCPSGGAGLSSSGKWVNHAGYGYESETPEDDMSGVRCFDTLPIRAAGWGYEQDPNFLTLRSRGDNYMGCNGAQRAYPSECSD